MEEEFIRNQEQMKPLEEKQEVNMPTIVFLLCYIYIYIYTVYIYMVWFQIIKDFVLSHI